MPKTISHIDLTPTIALTECRDGFWLYDATRGMNLAMRAPTAQAALLEALTYYQERLGEVERAHAGLRSRVELFVSQFTDQGSEAPQA